MCSTSSEVAEKGPSTRLGLNSTRAHTPRSASTAPATAATRSSPAGSSTTSTNMDHTRSPTGRTASHQSRYRPCTSRASGYRMVYARCENAQKTPSSSTRTLAETPSVLETAKRPSRSSAGISCFCNMSVRTGISAGGARKTASVGAMKSAFATARSSASTAASSTASPAGTTSNSSVGEGRTLGWLSACSSELLACAPDPRKYLNLKSATTSLERTRTRFTSSTRMAERYFL
ncbi:PP76 [Orf virus]|uniref:PP76 n=1 Tax=Orf virus TaxID=10258 RepID=F1AX60_ORFV|nr:PP76 [Orf virus]